MDTNFGAVLFDDPRAHDSGWACTWRGIEKTQPIRIANTGELSSDTVWLTNLDYETSTLSGLMGLRFRRGDYFHHNIEKIWSEIGLNLENPAVDPKRVWGGRYTSVDMLRPAWTAWLFRQVVQTGSSIVPVNAPVLPTMPRGLASRLVFPIRGQPSKDIFKIMGQADLAWQPVIRRAYQDAPKQYIRLRPHRVTHAIRLLSKPWPVTWSWRGMTSKSLNKHKNITEWLLQFLDEHPFVLLRVTVTHTDHPFERLINFGANIQNKPEQNKWITGVDFRRLAPFCHMKVHHLLYNDGKGITGFDVLEQAGINIHPESWAMRAGSYSFGLFLEMLWRAFMVKPEGMKLTFEESHPASVFLRAYDRDILFEYALRLIQKGYDIYGYGSGFLLLEINEDGFNIADIARDAIAVGLYAPFVPSGEFQADDAMMLAMHHENDHLGESSRRLEMMMLMGDLDMIIAMDEALSMWSP